MKNYNINFDTFNELKTYILNYEITKGDIIIHLANHKKYIIPYTEENEKQILSQMEKQVYNKQYKCDLKDTISTMIKFLIGHGVALVIFTILTFLSKEPATMPLLAEIFFSLATILDTSIICICKSKLKDREKNLLFLQEQEHINSKILTDANTLENVSEKSQIIINEKNDNLNINDIDKMSLKDLKRILENIQTAENFKFSTPKTSYIKRRKK